MDFTYQKTGSIFNAHSYWTKQPAHVVEKFINKYSHEGDLILDPFCGTGMTGVAAIKTNRRFILSDISPICLHIAKGYCTRYPKVDITEFIRNLTKDSNKYYCTKCPDCGRSCEISFVILRDDMVKNRTTIVEKICFKCVCSKKKKFKFPDLEDLKLHETLDFQNHFYPKEFFFGTEPRRNFKRSIYQVYQLYSNRNLSALSRLWENIKNIESDDLKQLASFAFSSILFNCSLLSRYNERYENTQIKMGTFYIPLLIKDNNVVQSYTRKIRTILKANEEIFSAGRTLNGKIQFDDATLLKNVEEQSIDYIYTDPPYSDVINYSELNLVFESWLGKSITDNSLEMVVDKAKNKTVERYEHMFSSFLKNAYRVLKYNKRLTLIFHNVNIEHWAAFQRALQNSDFLYETTEFPTRIISKTKTASQISTGKNAQCFLAFNLFKSACTDKKDLPLLSKADYIALIEEMKSKARESGYLTSADQFDYIINRLIFNCKIRTDIKI